MEMTDPPPHDFRTVSLNKLKVLSKDVDDRRNILGKSWDELQLALSQYHASLVVRQEQFELQTVDSNAYVTKLENELQKRTTENDQIKTKLSDLECKLRSIQEENLSLRTEKERLENDVRLKENLMIKIQNQMSKESLEYSAEISALKESLSKMSGGQRKRPRSTQSPVSKSDAAPSDSTHKDAPPTFSVATMPHLALATTSSEALESDTTYDYDVSNSVATVNHQVIQVPPLSQAKGKKTRTSPRPKPPRVEFVQPGQVTAHACKVCGRSFGARYDLQRHERIHSGEKPFFCSGCNRRFARKDHLRLHMVRVHGLEDGASLQKESVEILIQGEDRDPLTVLREQQLAYQESLQGMIKEENGAMFPSNLYDT